MNRLLTDYELSKLNSMEGIIELLCDIPNFKEDMYDELPDDKRILVDNLLSIDLVTNGQINANLLRSRSNNNLALLNSKRLTALALLYFGVKDNTGKYIGYTCPYTGIYYDLNELRKEQKKAKEERNKDKILELEHIKPHSSGGGTILFNTIPASHVANQISEKGSLHLLDWFFQSGGKYYNSERVYKLINYVLSAYSISFNEYNESELDYYNNDDSEDIDNNEYSENDIDIDIKDIKTKNKKNLEIGDYIPFINRLIDTFRGNKVVYMIFESKLKDLQDKNIISNINKYQIVQNAIENLFSEYTSSYLSNSLKVDYVKLVNSIKSNDKEIIIDTLKKRISNIKILIDEENKTMDDYFLSMNDLRNNNIDILYKDVNINDRENEDIIIFINNIKISYNTKINTFIDMLALDKYTSYKDGKPDENNIFSQYKKIPFLGYEDISGLDTSYFWSHNSDKIKERLREKITKLNKPNLNDVEEKELDKLNKAWKAIDNYEFQIKTSTSGLDKRVDRFIDMLALDKYTSYKDRNPDENNIFSNDKAIPFLGYEDISGLDTSQFWSHNSDKIKERLRERITKLNKPNLNDVEEKELDKLNKAWKAIDNYEFQNKTSGLDKRIEKFIDMLSLDKYTSYKNGKPDENNIFSQLNKVLFLGYEDINGLDTSWFWNSNSDKIKERLREKITKLNKPNRNDVEEKELDKLNKAWKAIDNYEFQVQTGLDKRIDRFIDMLALDKYTSYKNGKPDENNIFKENNKIPFLGYEDISGLNTSRFWNNNSVTGIIPRLFYNQYYDKNKKKFIGSDKDYSGREYDKARGAILRYLKVNNIDEYIDKLNKEKEKNRKLIELRDSLIEKDIRFKKREEKLIIENNELKSNINGKRRSA